METSEAVTQILNRHSGALLEKARFGRSERALYRVSESKLVKIAGELRNEAGFDWLENLSAMEHEGELVFTYFLRSASSDLDPSSPSGDDRTVILRTAVPLKAGSKIGSEDWVEMESASAIWPMAALREREISRLFGVKFSCAPDKVGDNASEGPLAEGFEGFPLRKSFSVTGAPGGVLP